MNSATTSLRDAASRVIAAFKAHGSAAGLVAASRTRKECEAAMLGLEAALSTPPAGEWVAVSERLPEMDRPVWLVDEGGHVWVGARGDTGDGWLWGNAYDSLYRDVAGNIESSDNEADDDYRPTHWHALPGHVPASAPEPATQEVG